jgi:ATP-dependent DNA ligase
MAPRMHYVEHLEAHGEARFAMVCELDLEGIVAKQADSPYRGRPLQSVAEGEEPKLFPARGNSVP